MPLRSLTPLGRQLRSVLATIRTPGTNANIVHSTHPLSGASDNRMRNGHGIDARRTVWAGTAAVVPEFPTADQQELETEQREGSTRIIKRRTRVNRITEALRKSRQHAVLPAESMSKIDHSYYNVRARGGRRRYAKNALRHQNDFLPNLMQTKEVTLEKILGSHIYHRASVHEDRLVADWMAPFRLTEAEAALLHTKGFDVDDVSVWDTIITSPSSLGAATALADRTSTQKRSAVPLFVLLYLLRRPHISAPALRILARQAWLILDARLHRTPALRLPLNAVFLVFVRLIRHARQVLPGAMESITAILLHFLPKAVGTGEQLTAAEVQTLTFMLNKAMRLIAVRTAVQPFKHNRYQEFALISILRFMAEHNPPLQTNREGYRAVISVQLTQVKTRKERQWAELKGLSWPPWKQERTAVDFDITADNHGVSKARETLLRMQEAGYAHHDWEKVASIYAGWDTDGTPTIQTRVLFDASASSLRIGTAAWTARINTTRTAQEAWACYLAYEDSKLPSDQDVYTAIFQKLSQEEKRKRQAVLSGKDTQSDDKRQWYPGDRKEIKPLPPSTHLYTYTRTPPPTVDDLYTTLHERGVVFSGHCLAFLINNASSLESGLRYLRHSLSAHPQLAEVLDHRLSDASSTRIPMPIFEAVVGLLARFPNGVPQLDLLQSSHRPGRVISALSLDGHKLNSNHALVRAFELVYHRRPSERPPWNSIFTALARDTPLRGLYSSPTANALSEAGLWLGEDDVAQNAILVYRLTRKLLALMRHSHIDLDVVGFRALCQVTENTAVACWKTLQYRPMSAHADHPELFNVLQSSSPTRRLTAAFRELVGSDGVIRFQTRDHAVEVHDASQLPSALERMGPAVLHSYVRALGWMADYNGILETVRWMVKYNQDLNDNFKLDSNGEIMIRRLMTAIRVFLERSWLLPIPSEAVKDIGYRRGGSEYSIQMALETIRQPADSILIDEIRELMESVEEWGGWPEDEEVEEYCKHHRFEDTK